MQVFQECVTRDAAGNSFELSMIGQKCIGAYVKNKKNQNQICWIWQKVSSENDRGFQRFLDNVQYKSSGILRYERVFGQGFVSTGGIETTKEFVEKMDLKPGQKVLDVGCGIGGGDSTWLRTSMFMSLVADCTTKHYPENSFDVIYSRDTILHIQDKPALFRTFFKWLKPGGKVLISDYCKSSETPSPEFSEYIKQRGYDLHDVQAYGQMLKEAGFNDVIADDRTDQFMQVLRRELERGEKERKSSSPTSPKSEDYEDIVGGWKAKLERSASGEQKWGLFIANKN
ncbi:hypothetical protein HID58_020434 [Brassica napus]|uniref:phosphoethanolamine N-methyltransferase n=1 Tax=Brassica napus TaxID=3708 RepID=A0ABQ7XJI4_BRANA|nr:hypothetical protein HID58_020434 [Brassica napus]